jgi:uncharacterized protein DUF4157
MSLERSTRSAPSGHVTSTADGGATSLPGPGKQTLTSTLPVPEAPVQRQSTEPVGGGDVHAAAAHGTRGGGTALPHLDTIQRLFGHHDISHVQAHVGGSAAEGAAAMGAEAFATGDRVAFARPPDVHTAAHEAAHVVQQRAGVQLKGGVGEVGDSYERHADAVADAVVRGESAEALLDQHAGQRAGAHPAVIQRKPTKRQAGTVAQFLQVFNNTPSGMGRTRGQDAHNAMLRLGQTEMSFPTPLPTTTPYFNERPARYIYSTQGGWIDMVHFLFHAGRAYQYLIDKRDAARSLEEIQSMPWYQRMWLPPEYLQQLQQQANMSPIGESVQEGFVTERVQSVVTPRSAYSYEDLPSDTFGARFAVQHFNPNSPMTFGEQLAAYLNDVLGAVEANQAPNYGQLPADDDGTVDRQNTTTTPVYTAANP